MQVPDQPRYKEIQKLWDEGVRARDRPLWLIEDLIERPEVEWMKYRYQLVAYYAYLDRRMFEKATEAIEVSEVECCQFFWDTYDHLAHIRLERAFIMGFLRRQLAEANQLLEEIEYKDQGIAYAEHRARAALHAAKGEMDEARREIGVATKLLLEESPDVKPNIQAELDWLQWILEIPA